MAPVERGADPDGFRAVELGNLRAQLEIEPDDYAGVTVDESAAVDNREEFRSLMQSMAGFGNGRTTGNRPAAAAANKSANQPAASSPSSFSLRNIVLVGGLAVLVFLFVDNLDVALEAINTTSDVDESAGYKYMPNHESSFGGIYNMGHPAGAKAAEEGHFDSEEIFVPVSNVGHAVQSISAQNILNFQGHYLHDEHNSPYASHLYDRPKEELEKEQERYLAKMAKIREEYGAWNFSDEWFKGKGPRPIVDFSKAHYRDVPSAEFVAGSWQTDKEYTVRFIEEAKALVNRVLEGIYAEYGKPTKKADGSTLSDEERKERDALWGVDHVDGAEAKGIAQFNEHSWNGLIRKLLHAMITHDDFYVVLGGHSSAAGHGNNFRQTKAMQFHIIMEPVFDKLGVRLITRNSAQGGVGTTHSAMGSGSVYGEKDILLWDR